MRALGKADCSVAQKFPQALPMTLRHEGCIGAALRLSQQQEQAEALFQNS
jgi:hypothetical protein